MSTLRLSIAAIGLFAMTFIGVSWANKGFPVMALRAAPPQPSSQPDLRQPAFEQTAKPSSRKDQVDAKPVEDDDPNREALRLAALQAANAFALSPCDPAMKKTLVMALSAYARAWTEMAGCKSGVCGGSDNKLDAAATAAFSTPADMRVRAALRTAFEKGGVSRGDFPNSIRLWVTMLVGDPGDPVSTCAAGKRAEATQQ